MIDSKTFARAIIFAAKKHKNQIRKGDKKPYFLHPASVMKTVYDLKRDSKNAFLLGTAAILHDVVEDCGVNIKTIYKKFGPHVASLVKELTLDKKQYEILGKTEYLSRNMIKMSSYALTIKLCDRLDNIKDSKDMPKDWIENYKKETLQIFGKLLKNRKLTKTQDMLVSQIGEEMKKL